MKSVLKVFSITLLMFTATFANAAYQDFEGKGTSYYHSEGRDLGRYEGNSLFTRVGTKSFNGQISGVSIWIYGQLEEPKTGKVDNVDEQFDFLVQPGSDKLWVGNRGYFVDAGTFKVSGDNITEITMDFRQGETYRITLDLKTDGQTLNFKLEYHGDDWFGHEFNGINMPVDID